MSTKTRHMHNEFHIRTHKCTLFPFSAIQLYQLRHCSYNLYLYYFLKKPFQTTQSFSNVFIIPMSKIHEKNGRQPFYE